MFEKLTETYGVKLSVSREIRLSGVPVYMLAGRQLYEVQYEGIRFLAVYIKEVDRIGSIALEKQLNAYRAASQIPVAYVFDKLTFAQRAALIKKRIPFISDPDQIYLPFIGLLLKGNLTNKEKPNIERMMPATQSLFLYLVYSGTEGCLKKDAAEKLKLTKTSISRASDQLSAMGLIHEERSGREIRMYPTCGGEEAFEAARSYLIDPVQKSLYVKLNFETEKSVISGESALGLKTMLNIPKIPVYAIGRNSDLIDGLKEINPEWETDIDICKVEIWKYDPVLFSDEGCADPISLAMSFSRLEDERIETAMEAYMENYKW